MLVTSAEKHGFMQEFALALGVGKGNKAREYLLPFVNATSILLISSRQECKSGIDRRDDAPEVTFHQRLRSCYSSSLSE